MDSPEFKPFELKDFDSEVSVQEAAAVETDGFKPMNYSAGEDYAVLGEVDEKTETEKIDLSENFHTDHFQREDSLLTNAEDYARNIREGAALYKQKLVAENEAALKETERIKQETLALRKSAEEEKLKMIDEARAEVQGIKDEAFKEGFEKGLQEGIEKRYPQAAPLVERVEEVLRQLASLRQIVRFQGDLIESLLKAALKEVESKGKIRILLHPEDHEFLVQSGLDLDPYVKEEQSLLIKSDPDASPGSIHMESDEEVINFHFQKRFEELEDLLSIELSERHARLDEADMDQFDYSKGNSESTDAESTAASEAVEPSEEIEAASEGEAAVVTAEAQEDSTEEEAPSEIDDAEASAEDGIEENVPA